MEQRKKQQDMSGILFKNTRKEKPNHPDRTGSATVRGVEYFVSGWVKQDRNGDPFMSLAFKPKEAPADKPTANTAKYGIKDEMDDEIPF